jgi:DNA-binding transcriptional ArsR family regulator
MKIVDEGTAQLVMHPVRFKILRQIAEAPTKQFVEEIAEAINEHPRLVSHHLNVLQDVGLINCTYEATKAKGSKRRRVAVRFCTPTPKLAEVFEDVAKAAKLLVEEK